MQNSAEALAVLSFRANEYTPGATKFDDATWVGRLSKDQVEAACPRFGEVQDRTNAAADAVTREGNTLTPQGYGTEVHLRVKEGVETLSDPNFRAEVSLIKSADAIPRKKGSIRIDVLENTLKDTVCVYDIKTGQAGLLPGRSLEIANEVQYYYGSGKRILLIEVRPKK
jgi:hypothetical protein